jgi:hypothetical protein
MAEPQLPNVDEAIRSFATPPELRDARRNEDQALQMNYPGEYVAYQDFWEPPVLRREVLAHDRSLKAVHDALAGLSDRELDSVEVAYCDEPGDPGSFRGGYNRLRLPNG